MLPVLAGMAIMGAMSYLGSQQANSANRAMANQQMDFQAGQTQAQMDFQREMANSAQAFSERMSNTSYQRGMEDMRAAGLNPLLSYQQGGATAPQGVSASGASAPGATAHMENALGNAAGSALQAANVLGNLEQTFASVDRTKAETQLLASQDVQTQANTALTVQQARNAGFDAANIKARLPLTHAQTRQASSAAVASAASAHLMGRQAETEGYRPDLVRAETRESWLRGNLRFQEDQLLGRYGDAERIAGILRNGTLGLSGLRNLLR